MKLSEIQKALYSYLDSNLDVVVDNRLSLDTTMPYVAMGDLSTNRNSARGLEGLDLRQELLVFSNFDGKDEVINIVDAIRELVAGAESPVSENSATTSSDAIRESMAGVELEIAGVNAHSQTVESITITQVDEKLYEGEITLQFELFEF